MSNFDLSNWFKNHRDNIAAISNLVIAIVAILGFIAAIFAYQFYKDANRISLSNTLEASDNEIYNMAVANNKPYLLRTMYCSPPDIISSPRGKAEYCFQSLFDKNVKIEWETVPGLVSLYTQNKKMRTEEGKRVTEAILAFEKVLAICETVNNKKEANMLNGGVWKGYTDACIDDYGNNPLFLAAIHIDHHLGYIDKKFSEYLKSRLKDNSIVKSIYPEMIQLEWINKNGKGY
jgi:hypothetical protein